MKTFLNFLTEKQNVAYSYSSIQLNANDKLAKEIYDWGKELIPKKDLYEEKDDNSYGREDDMHVTIFYGLHTDDSKEIKEFLKNEKPFEVILGKISLFDNNKKYDVVKIDVEGNELRDLNKKIKSNFENSNKYPNYQPHLTIAYVKKGTADVHVGKDKFNNKKIKVNEIIFSSKDGKKTNIKLK